MIEAETKPYAEENIVIITFLIGFFVILILMYVFIVLVPF